MNYIKLFFSLFLISNPMYNYAQNAMISTKSKSALQKAQASLSQKKVTTTKLNEHIKALLLEAENANQCVEEQEKKLASIEKSIKLTKSSATDKKTNADLNYLNKQATKAREIYSECRLYALQSEDTINSLKESLIQKSQATIWLKKSAIADLKLQNIIKDATKITYTPNGMTISNYHYLILFVLALIITTIIGYSTYIKNVLRLLKLSAQGIFSIFLTGTVIISLIACIVLLDEKLDFPDSYETLIFLLSAITAYILFRHLLINFSVVCLLADIKKAKRNVTYALMAITASSVIAYLSGYKNLAIFTDLSIIQTLAYLLASTLLAIVISRSFHLITHHEIIKVKLKNMLVLEKIFTPGEF